MMLPGDVSPTFWRGRRVLVTGHDGFKGGWLVVWLHALGAEVCGYGLPGEPAPTLFDLVEGPTLCRDERGDVTDRPRVGQVFDAFQPEIVLHLAAQPLVLASYGDPVRTYATNVLGTVHVLDACVHCTATRACVVVTSDKVYENRETTVAYREIDPVGGHDPYSSSKACAELVASAYRRSFAQARVPPLGIATARSGNVLGGGDFAANRLVPDLLRAASRGQTARIRRPRAIRPWQDVTDVSRGYLLLAERLLEDPAAHAEAWNFGPAPRDAPTVAQLVEIFVRAWGAGVSWRDTEEAGAPHEATLLALDSSKARDRLGWKPRVDASAAMARAVAWYRAQLDGASPAALRALMIRQLGEASYLLVPKRKSSSTR